MLFQASLLTRQHLPIGRPFDYHRGSPGHPLKLLRATLGLLLLVTWIIRDMPEASPHDAGVEGTALRGEGARIRARIQRIVATTDTAAAMGSADNLLAELYDRRSAEDDRLPLELREELAHEVLGIRTQLLLQDSTLAAGFRRDCVASIAPGAVWSDW